MPARKPSVSSSGAKQKRSGTRCTTLTQLPLAFCGGRIANCAPVPGAIEQTVPCQSRSGKRVDGDGRRQALLDVGQVGFLGIGVDPKALVGDDGEHRLPRRRDAAELDLRHLRGDAGDGAP